MIYRLVTALTLYTTSIFGVATMGGDEQGNKSEATVRAVAISSFDTPKWDDAELELRHQMTDPRTPPLSYWHKVAECETQNNWQNKGRWAGGLGIYTNKKATPKHFKTDAGTWERAGGEQFAPSPDKATITQQIVVANRIALFGYTHNYTLPAGYKGAPMSFTYRWKPVGYNGWGCIANTIGAPKIRKAK